jgi:hypothetical protein
MSQKIALGTFVRARGKALCLLCWPSNNSTVT